VRARARTRQSLLSSRDFNEFRARAKLGRPAIVVCEQGEIPINQPQAARKEACSLIADKIGRIELQFTSLALQPASINRSSIRATIKDAPPPYPGFRDADRSAEGCRVHPTIAILNLDRERERERERERDGESRKENIKGKREVLRGRRPPESRLLILEDCRCHFPLGGPDLFIEHPQREASANEREHSSRFR